jgi:hypothetical protein
LIDRAEFDTIPPEPLRLAWTDWLRHHTIDPEHISVPGFIEVDFDTYRIRWLAYDLDEQGNYYFWPGTEQVAQSVRALQLEARPSPFPEQCVTSP